jgi:outer membrane lipoprotein SlyB
MKRFVTSLIITLLLSSATFGGNGAKPVELDETAELLKILKETDSRDAFLLTLQILVEVEPRRDGLLPTVIRRADKLGLLKGMSSGKLTAEQETLANAMGKILDARTSQKQSNTAGGALVGSGLGALIGGAIGRGPSALIGNAEGSLVGNGSGAIVGVAIGNCLDAESKKKATSLSKATKEDDIKTVYIPIFNNKTFQITPYRGMEFELTRAVIREVESKGYKVISDPNRADTELLGTLRAINKNITKRTQENEVGEGQLCNLAVAIVWRDLRSGFVLSNPPKDLSVAPAEELPPFDPDNLPRPEALEKANPVMVTMAGNYLPEVGETNPSAQTRVCNQLAKQIANMMEKDWRRPSIPHPEPELLPSPKQR